MQCPKCGFDCAARAADCPRCGLIFARWQGSREAQRKDDVLTEERTLGHEYVPASSSVVLIDDPEVADGRVGAAEWKILGGGLIAAIIANAVPLIFMVLSALVTLCHEFGHAVAGWLLGYPSLPAFDFVYGGGFTHMGEFHVSIALLIGGAFAYLLWLFRENRRALILLSALLLIWLLLVSGEWRRELVVAAAGHAAEFILAGIFFYQALSGVGWRNPELERPLGAFVAFFIQIHSMRFAWRLIHDAAFLQWYREGKGGALMNDLEVVALDLNIYLRLNPGIIGVARGLLIFSLLPMSVALLWYWKRRSIHRLLRSMTVADE